MSPTSAALRALTRRTLPVLALVGASVLGAAPSRARAADKPKSSAEPADSADEPKSADAAAKPDKPKAATEPAAKPDKPKPATEPAVKPGKPKSAPERSAPTTDETKDAARNMGREALELMHEERWAEAQSLLSRAYRLVPAPTLALLEGRSLEQMGKLVEARDRYAVARKPEPDDVPDAWKDAALEAARRLPELEKLIPRLSIALERDAGDPRQATVMLDGAVVAERDWASPRQVNPGEHVVSATLDGGVAVEDHVLLRQSDSKQVLLRLRAAPQAPEPAARVATTAEPTRTWGWVALGVGGAGLVTGVVAGLVMLDAKSSLDDACARTCPEKSRDDLDRFRTFRWVSAIGYSVGIVGIGTGAALLLLSPGAPQSSPRASLRLGPRGAMLEGSF